MRECSKDKTHQVGAYDYFCEECGSPVESLGPSCPKGHQVFNPSAKFCYKCGAKLQTKSLEEEAA